MRPGKVRKWVSEGLESGLKGQGRDGLSGDGHLPRKEVELCIRLDWARDAPKLEGGLVLEILR